MNFVGLIDGISGNALIGSGVVNAFMDSNLAGKVIVIILGVFSIWAWTVMIGKKADLHALADSNKRTETKIARSSSAIVAASDRSLEGPFAAILKEAAAAWGRTSEMGDSSEALSLRMGHVENAIQRALNRQTIKYESKMVMLGSIISGAPFLGLLGTVWGVMDSFGAVGMQATVTLQMLAPGVSGALLTTVSGLVVAIPSVFGYNYLLSTSRGMVTAMENFASSLADKIELEARETRISSASAASAVPQQPETGSSKPYSKPSVSEKSSAPSRIIKFSLDDEEDAPDGAGQ